jgi:hypothetical protein
LLSKKEADQPQIVSTKKLSLLSPRNLACLADVRNVARCTEKMVGGAAGILNGKIVLLVGRHGFECLSENMLNHRNHL